ncbi:MAG: DNA polymerase III subunit delta', partial [Flavobacteriales bacterium]|nr:DNA polymerase III subunit delta' [Flavobacteriales bacterium]
PYLDDEVWRRELNGENKQLTIGVDIAQEVNRQLSLKAYRGGWKVMLIWLPEAMNLQAANKLLKVLEEPEERTVFLLVAHQAEHLLPTILSR